MNQNRLINELIMADDCKTCPALQLIKYPNEAAMRIDQAWKASVAVAPAIFDRSWLHPFASTRLKHALRYYGLLDTRKYKEVPKSKQNFILHHQKQTKDKNELPTINADEIYERIKLMLEHEGQHIEFLITPEQLAPNFNHIIKHHGNHFLTGAPFMHGGVPYIMLFQWGNLFGVIKFIELDDEKALKANILIYFEDMADRTLEECVADYKQKEMKLLDKMPEPVICTPQVMPQFTLKLQPQR